MNDLAGSLGTAAPWDGDSEAHRLWYETCEMIGRSNLGCDAIYLTLG